MTAAPMTDARFDDLLQGRMSMSVAACDGTLQPTLMRALGCRLSADRRRITLFISATQAAPLLRCVRENGRLAMVFTQPTTHRTLQLKGRDATIGGLQAGDLDLMEAYRRAFAAEVAPIGFTEDQIRVLLACPDDDAVSITFTPDEIYEQTPGPNAGERLKAAS